MPISTSRPCMASSRTPFWTPPARSRAGWRVATEPNHHIHRWHRRTDMPDTNLIKSSGLAEEMRAHMGLFTEKSFDWDAFPASRGFPDLTRAQLRYVGAG